jgi:hypothetical protein
MSSSRLRATLPGSPASPNPTLPDPVAPDPVASNSVAPNFGTVDSGSATASRPSRRRRARGRSQRGLVRPRCPEHGGEMLVGRTVGCVQYRYCTVEGCPCAVTTFRSDAPHKRWPPAGHQAAARRAQASESGNDSPGTSAGQNLDGVTIIPQESPVIPAEWPAGRPLPGQSS